jgi:hypothetical protein
MKQLALQDMFKKIIERSDDKDGNSCPHNSISILFR